MDAKRCRVLMERLESKKRLEFYNDLHGFYGNLADSRLEAQARLRDEIHRLEKELGYETRTEDTDYYRDAAGGAGCLQS